jgi:outer membrane protein TolC
MVFLNRVLLAVILLTGFQLSAQTTRLSLNEAYDLAEKNYPAIKRKDLIRQTADLTIQNLEKGYLPQLNLSGQASYQSDVTKIDVPLPGFNIPSASKDQYKLLADVNQLIYDGGMIRQQKISQKLNEEVEDQKLAVELYQLKDRINQVFLGVLYLDEQLKQAALMKADLDIGIKQVEAQVNNGVAFRSNLDLLKAEALKADQKIIELNSSRKGLIRNLSVFLNQELDEHVQLETPAVAQEITQDITRPEIKLYTDQSRLLEQQTKLIKAKNLPKTNLFVQGGYGRPGLNMLKNDFTFYYIGGVRLNWPLNGLYTQRNEKQLVKVNQKLVDIQKETFVLNTNTQLTQQQAEIDKYKQLVETDKAIIDLRLSVQNVKMYCFILFQSLVYCFPNVV